MEMEWMCLGPSRSWRHKQVTWRSWSNASGSYSVYNAFCPRAHTHLQLLGVCLMVCWLRKRRLDPCLQMFCLLCIPPANGQLQHSSHCLGLGYLKRHRWREIFTVAELPTIHMVVHLAWKEKRPDVELRTDIRGLITFSPSTWEAS